ncbi:MAG: CaiB/BaiF CoA transferase family protein [Dehalococcoidia bacterium]
MGLPLDGIRVLEVAEWILGPSACAVLGDWGAEVIKIEHPVRGDGGRGVLASGVIPMAKINYLFEVANRNKKSVAVDLNTEKGREIVNKLVARSDVFLTNFLTTARKRLKLEHEDLAPINPGLIYIKVHGYGQKGPEIERGGYDFAAFWARGGIASVLAEPGASPPAQRPGFGDMTGAMFSAGAVAAALFARERTGKGQAIDVSLLGSALWVNALDTLAAYMSGQEIAQMPRGKVGNPLWNTYQALDGKWLQLVNLQSDRYWPGLCKAIGREDLEHEPRFESHEERAQNNTALIELLDDVFATRPAGEWGRLLDDNGVLWAPMQRVSELASDPQVVANQYLVDIDHPVHGPTKLVASPAQFNDMPASIRTPAPELGQHTEAVLLELGYSWGDMEKLKEEGVIV